MMHGRGKSNSAIVAEKPTNKAGRPTAESVEPRAGPRGMRYYKARAGHRTGKACPRRWDRIRQVARQRKKEKFTALLHHISAEHLEAAFSELKENAAPGVDGLTGEHTRRPLIVISRTCTRGSIEECTERCRPDGSTYPSQTVGSGHSRLPPLKIRSCNGRPSGVLNAIYEEDFCTGSDQSAGSTMRWTLSSSGSPPKK